MFLELNPAYAISVMLFLAFCGYLILSQLSALGNSGVRTRRIYNVTSVLLMLYSLNYAFMTITVNETLRFVLWAIGFSSGLLFFPVWILFLLHMVPQKQKIIVPLSAASIVVAVIIAVLCVFFGDTALTLTRFGNQFSYYQNIYFIIAFAFTSVLTIPLVILQFKWWSGAELLRYKRLARIFVVLAASASAVGFVTDFVVPIFTLNTFTPLGPLTVFSASLATYLLMFSNKTQRINVRNVSGFTFSSIMIPVLVLDRKNKVGLENKAAEDFFGTSLMEKNIIPFLFSDEKMPRSTFFDESFDSEIVTVETPIGIRICDMMLTVEKDKLGDTIFKVVVIRDITETNYKDNLLEAVNQVSSILLEPDIGHFEINLYMAMGMMAKAVNVDRVYVWENRVDDSQLRCTQIYEWSEGAEPHQDLEHTIDISYDSVFAGFEDILSSGYCLNEIVSRMDPAFTRVFVEQGILSLLVTPVFIQDTFWGFVGFDDCHKERVFTESEEFILRSASRLIVNAMIRNDMTQKLDTALTDELTGARNRRFFMEVAEEALLSCIENEQPYALIIIDVDFFKKVNDTYGHPVGDEVLKILVSRIRNSLKQDTLLARYGGEEFVVSLPEIGVEDALGTAERIRAGIESDTFKIDDIEIDVTISLGVALHSAEAKTLACIISNADKALYKAKQTGRNKVVCFDYD